MATVNTPLAVVMPTRNQAGFITESVRSVFAQGIPGLQLFVQDGDSDDGTQGVLADLALQHAGLHWVSEPDDGPAEAVNKAFARALADTDAPVLGWLNSDDLYAPGAAGRAMALLQAQPDLVMVYGEGEHIDLKGQVSGRYPTRGPQTPLPAWADGCHICQPTVFLRRQTWVEAGGLDTGLRTAFDYELWLRLLKRYPGRIGARPEVQAQSRLHAGAITLRLRETVALEGLQVVHRHLGAPPAHWLLTHFDEVMAGVPCDGSDEDPTPRLLRLVLRAEPWLSTSALSTLRRRVAGDRGWRLATPHWHAEVQADGWTPARFRLRVRQPAQPYSGIRLRGLHAGPQAEGLRLQASGHELSTQVLTVPRQGSFDWTLPLPWSAAAPADDCISWHIECLNPHSPGQGDTRRVGFVLAGLEGLR